MATTELERSLQSGPEPVYVVLGDALPLVDRALVSIFEAVRPHLGPAAFNHNRFRAAEITGPEPFLAARTLPMMAARRLIEVREVHEAPTAFWEALLSYLGAPVAEAVVVLSGGGFPKVEKGGSNWGAKVKNALKKGNRGLLLQIGGQDVQPVPFVTDLAGARGKDLGRREAELLVEIVGGDLGRLQQEIEKLVLYVGDARCIGPDDVVAVGSVLAEAVIWDLTTGLAVRDAGLALGALYRLQAGGDDARKLLGMIAWQMRELLRAADLVRGGASDRDVASAVRLRWDVLRRVRPVLAEGFPDAADLLRRIAFANRQMNSHRAGADRILEGLVLEMLEGGLRRPPTAPRWR